MDPFTIALLLGGGLGLAQGIGQSKSNNPQQKLNIEKLDELLQLQKSGGLGLTGAQQRNMALQQVTPIRKEATAARSRQEQLLASTAGTVSGTDLSQMRQESSKLIGNAAAQAAAQIAAANEAKKLQQEAEIEGRTALKGALRQDDWNAILGGVAQLAGPIGLAAGGPPGTSQLGPLFGQQFGAMSFSDPEVQAIKQLYQRDPEALQAILADLEGGA